MATISENSKGRLSLHFESVRDVFNTISTQGWVPKHDRASERRKSGDSFYAFETLDEAMDVYLNHPEKVRTFSNADVKLESIESPGKDIFYDVTGDYVDIGRYLDGDPENMGNMAMGNPRSVFATINVMISKVHWTDERYIERTQRRVLRLVDWLESQDIRCQIVATTVSEVLNFSCIVKQFTDPVDLNDLAVVCHTDFFRRVVFLLKEQSKTWTYGYGSADDYDTRMKKYTPQPEDGLYVYVGGYFPHSGNDTDELDKEFDKIEKSVHKMIEDNMTWNEKPLAVKGGRR